MPYSSNSGKAYIDRVFAKLKRFAPDVLEREEPVILDIGAGSGTYVDRYRAIFPKAIFFGVEIWEPYIEKFKLREKYDRVVNFDAEDYLKLVQNHDVFDVTFLGDVVEHMELEKARNVIDMAVQASRIVIISLPIGYYPQDEYEGNPYEKHVTDSWTLQSALDFLGSNVVAFHQDNEIGVFILSFSHHDRLRAALKPKLAVYGICKNERSKIEEFLDELEVSSGYIDQAVICDTGSTDGTFEAIQAYEASFKLDAYKIHVDPWRFDDARNTALSLIWPEIDYCISIDIDEYLSPNFMPELLGFVKDQPHLTRINHKFSTFWNAEKTSFTDHWHERVHARQGYRWVLPVHEKLEYQGQEEVAFLEHIRMYQEPDLNKPRSSYLPLLEQSVKERPDVWKSWSFLAGEYLGQNEYTKALNALTEAMKLADADHAYLTLQKAYTYWHVGDLEQAKSHFSQLLSRAPNVREYYVQAGNFYAALQDDAIANHLYHQALAVKTKTTGYTYDPSVWTEEWEQRIKRELGL